MRPTVVALVGVLFSGVTLAQTSPDTGSATTPPPAAAPAMAGPPTTPKPGEMVNNPPFVHWSQFKVGSSVTVKDSVRTEGGAIESTITSKLLAKDKEGVKIETVNTSGVGAKGVKSLERSTTVSFYPAMVRYEVTQSGAPAGYSVTEGKETLDVNGKKVETEWVEASSTNGDESSVEKIWTAREIPGGVVKRTMTKKKGAGAVSTETSLLSYKGTIDTPKKK